MPLDGLRDAPRTEWRLGYLTPAELDRALSEATVAIFPYGPSSTSRARCSRRSAPACRPSPTTSAVSPSRSAATAPGRVVPAGDVEALTEAVARAARRSGRARGRTRGRRAGARRAHVGRGGGRHLELYEELT